MASQQQFEHGDLVHDADQGLGVVQGVTHEIDDPERVYIVVGISGQSDDAVFYAREGLLSLVTREEFDQPAPLSPNQLRHAAELLYNNMTEEDRSGPKDVLALVKGLRTLASRGKEPRLYFVRQGDDGLWGVFRDGDPRPLTSGLSRQDALFASANFERRERSGFPPPHRMTARSLTSTTTTQEDR